MKWLITGISSGFGLAIAKAAIARGDIVAGTGRNGAVCQAFAALAPGRAIPLIMDATDHASVQSAVTEAEKNTGGVDVLVCNVGRGLVGAIEECSMAEIRSLFEVNVFGSIAVIQAMLPFMRARGAGHIVNITSVSGLAPWPGTAIYGASKYAMECIGQTLAGEVKDFGLKVTNVAPGGFRTDFSGRSLVYAAQKISDYDGAARDAERSIADHQGQEPGDPTKAAAAILCAVDAAHPPMHLLLGEDAIGYARGNIARLQSEMAQWMQLSLSTAMIE